MELPAEQKLLKIKSKKNYLKLIISIIWLLAFLYKITDINAALLKPDFKSKLFGTVIYLLAITSFYQVIWSILGETVFSVADKNLIIKSGIPYIKITKKYALNQISNVKIKSVANSVNILGLKFYSTWGWLGSDFADPEIPIVCFTYNKGEVILGGNLSPFNLDELKSWIS